MRKIAISLISALTLIATGQTAQAFHPASAPERIVPAAAVPSYITMDIAIQTRNRCAGKEISNAQALVGSKAKCIRSGVAAPSDPRAHTFSIGNPKSMYRD